MSATAANLIEHVLPEGVPLRQWVLTLPFPWRKRLGYDGPLLGALVRKFTILVEDETGTQKPAEGWVPKSGRATKISPARVTNDRAVVPAVIVVHQAKMKDAWCLATSLADRTAAEVVALYGKRFTIEETFRDTKDLRFGMGSVRRISESPGGAIASSCSPRSPMRF